MKLIILVLVLISINQIDSIDAKQAYFFNDEDSGLTLSEENEMWQRMFFGLIFAIVGGFITNVLSSSKEYGILNGIIIFLPQQFLELLED